jgi:hypothetical protein
MIKRYVFVFLLVFLTTSNAYGYRWYLSFEAGHCMPISSFDALVNDETVYGLSVDYLPDFIPGVRVAYNHQKFPFNTSALGGPMKIDSFGIWALMDYPFPQYLRFFGVIGPTYFSSQGTRELVNWDRSSDIGWSAGAGFDFQPYTGWGFRFQSIYNSAKFGREAPRASWVNSTVGMSFRF